MPKLKPRRSLRRRIKITGSGKVKRWKSGWNHYKTKKSAKRSRQLRTPTYMSSSQTKLIKTLVGR